MPATPSLVFPTHLKTVDEFEQWGRQHAHEGSYEFVQGRIIEKDRDEKSGIPCLTIPDLSV